jgi:hypothetical protein
MLNTGAAVQGFTCELTQHGATASCSMTVTGCGSLALYSTATPFSCAIDGLTVSAEYCADSKIVTVLVPQTADLEAAVEMSFAL